MSVDDQNLQIELHETKEIESKQIKRMVSTSIESPREGVMKLMKEIDKNNNKLSGPKYCSLFKIFILYGFWCTSRQKFVVDSNKKFSSDRIYSYRAQIRLIHLWVISLLILLFSNIDKVNISSGAIISVIFFILMILICVAIFIVCGVKLCGVAEMNEIKFLERINIIFGIPNHDHDEFIALFSVDRKYYGLIFLIFVCLASFVNLMIYTVFHISPSKIDQCEDNEILLTDVEFAGKCAVNQSSISQVYVFVAILAMTFFSYYDIRPEYITAMNSYLNEAKKKKVSKNINDLSEKIKDDLKIKWKESHRWYNRISEIILTYIVLFTFHLITYGIFRNDIFSGNIGKNALVFCIFIYIIDALLISIISYFLLIDILYHYTFPSYILDLLSKQFNSDTIHDIISWWHLRNYYLDCVIDIFASSIRGTMGAALIGCVILISFGFGWRSADKTVIFVFLFYVVVVISFALIIAKLAADIDTKQICHTHTLNREYLKLNLDDIQNNKYDAIINLISTDIKENSKPMRVFGIAMNAQFLIAIRASAFAVIMAYLFS